MIPKLRFPGFRGAWEVKKLGDIIRYTKGFAFRSEDYHSEGIRIIRASDLGATQIKNSTNYIFLKPEKARSYSRYLLRKGNIIITTVGSRPEMRESAVGRGIYINTEDAGLLNQNMLKIEPSNNINTMYVFAYINSPRYIEHIKAIKRGNANQANITVKDLLEYEIGTPELTEQKKIAGFLTVVDERVAAAEKKVELLKQYKKGVMQKIFTQQIRFKDKNGNDYPAWQTKKLGVLGSTYNGLSGKNGEDFGEGSPFITYVQIFGSSTIDVSKCAHVRISPGEKQNLVKNGDVFFTTSSETPEEVGLTSVLLQDVVDTYLNSFCFGYRLRDKDVVHEFVQFLFRSSSFRRKVIRLAQGSTRYNLSKVELMKTYVGLPIPEEQQKIANFLSTLDDKIKAEEAKLERAKSFKKSLLQRMFV